MRSTFALFGFCLLLAACTSPSAGLSDLTGSAAVTPPASSQPEAGALEQVPAELSIAHFADVRLEGTGLTLGDILEENTAYTRYAITYLSNGLTISGIMNIPKGKGPYPLVILNHGYIAPSVYTRGRGLKREQDYLARQGFVVLHTDYRGFAQSDESPDVREVYDAGLEYAMDSINAINAVRAANLPHVDARRVGMLGHSLGGGVTLNIAVARPDLVSAFVLYAPVHSDAWENFSRWRSKRDDADRTLAVLGTRAENPDAWDALSSLAYLKNITSPVLLFQGTKDSDVPPAWSDFLDTKLKALNKDVTYVSYEGEKHEFIPKWEDFMKRTTVFLRAHLAVQ
ncbi:MAG: alpha/beta fold hydrolase [Candidatus Peribacter sp.]|nr:alpha/beta fold hydrolase [Candidatus Peribacter sp.]